MRHRYALLALFLSPTLASASVCPEVVEFAAVVSEFLASGPFLSDQGRMLASATHGRRKHDLFQFFAVRVGAHMGVKELHSQVVILPMKQRSLLFFVPSSDASAAASVTVEAPEASARLVESYISGSCHSRCQKKLSDLFALHVLPHTVPPAIDRARKRVQSGHGPLSFDSFESLFRMIAKNWDSNGDAQFTIQLPNSESTEIVETPLSFEFRLIDDMEPTTTGRIRIPAASLEHAKKIVDQISQWLGTPVDTSSWVGGNNEFRFGIHLRANWSAGTAYGDTLATQKHLTISLAPMPDMWSEEGLV